MYKNALATAGIEDANVIVAGPFALSGTAALVGTFEAYEEMTGETLDESVVDAAMDELVTTGELEQSIDGEPEEIESMIADLRSQAEIWIRRRRSRLRSRKRQRNTILHCRMRIRRRLRTFLIS